MQQLAVRRSQTELEKVVEGLIFSFLLYVIVLPFAQYRLPIRWIVSSGQAAIQIQWQTLSLLLGLSIVLAILYAANLNHDWLLSLCRYIHLTERTSRSTIWNDAFQDIKGRYLAVGLSDGRTVIGYLRYYSDDPTDGSLFLEDAAWLNEDGQQLPIDGPGILLTERAQIQFVMFLNPAETNVAR